MRRSLTLRRATLTDLTPGDLNAVGGGPDRTFACSTTDCTGAIKSPSEIVAAVLVTVCACPGSQAGC